MSFWKAYKTRAHVPIIIFIAVFVPALVVGFVLWHFFSGQIESSHQKRLETSLQIFELIIENQLKSSEEALNRVAADNTLQVTIDLDIRPQLRKYLASQFSLTNLSFMLVTNDSGQELAAVGSLPPQFAPATQCPTSRTSCFNLFITSDNQIYAIFTVPVQTKEKMLGFIHGGFNFTSQEYRSYLMGKLDGIPVFSMDDDVVASTQPDLSDTDVMEGKMTSIKMGEENFKALRKVFLINNEKIILEVMISLEPLEERMGMALVQISSAFVAIIMIALFTMWIYGQKLRAEEARSRLEDQLRQAQKMEAVGTLAGGIAHDFNNILGAILGYAELALDEIPPESQATEFINEVLQACRRAKDLVRQILTFSRKSPQEQMAMAIYPLVNEAFKLIRATIPSTIEIHTSLDANCGKVIADPTQIHQVVMNLCTNAAQAMEAEGGILEIRLHDTDLTADDLKDDPGALPGPYVQLTIHDSGPGIPEEIKDLIFDPYFTTKGVGRGSGMGLAVVHGIMQTHNGFIRLESSKGQGTTFHLFFPRAEVSVVEQAIDERDLPHGQGNILIVDDEKHLVDVICQLLRRLGYNPTGQVDSIIALESVRRNPSAFDLVITDYAMPKLPGDKLIKEIRDIRPDMPTILCTGYGITVDEPRFQKLNINAFLFKPVNRKELAEIIQIVLKQRDE